MPGWTIAIITVVACLFVIVSILAAIAIPAYQNYLIRSRVSEGMTLADGTETALAEFYSNYARFPSSNSSAGVAEAASISGKYVSSVDAGKQPGTILVTFSSTSPQTANRKLDGKTLALVAQVQNNGDIHWICGGPLTTIPENYLPSDCRDEIGSDSENALSTTTSSVPHATPLTQSSNANQADVPQSDGSNPNCTDADREILQNSTLMLNGLSVHGDASADGPVHAAAVEQVLSNIAKANKDCAPPGSKQAEAPATAASTMQQMAVQGMQAETGIAAAILKLHAQNVKAGIENGNGAAPNSTASSPPIAAASSSDASDPIPVSLSDDIDVHIYNIDDESFLYINGRKISCVSFGGNEKFGIKICYIQAKMKLSFA